MAYIKTYQNWLPYALLANKKASISRVYGNGHTGIDSVANTYGNKVCAVIDGTVLNVYKSATLGNVIEYGTDYVRIAHYHLASCSVAIGDQVVAGQTQIGIEGNTGSYSTGKHLHTSIWIGGVLVDPELYLCGKKEFPKEEAKGEKKYMIRKVVSALNLRESASLSAAKVYANMPVGTVFLVTETKVISGTTWGKVFVVINGKTYTGWSNIATTWSVEI